MSGFYFPPMAMTEKDKRLVKEAENMSYVRWYTIDKLIEQADTEEAKSRLKAIEKFKYHLEERSEDML